MSLYKSIDEIIGKTPLAELSKIKEINNLESNIFAKLEYFNPAGSAKDRVAYAMLLKAKEDGLLKKDTVIIEPTSGNTGVGLSAVAARWGYRVIICMPETMSVERRLLMSAYGAELVLTEGSKGMKGAIEKAQELAKAYPSSFIPSQFDNQENANIHFKTTGPEIYEDLNGKVDIFVAGVGTGGTITGVGRYLKSKNKNIKIVAVEPFDSPVLSKGEAGDHKIQGIGAGFVPAVLDRSIIDEVVTVTTENAFSAGREIAKTEGYLCGISSGAALYAAKELAKKYENKNIVALLPDTGERYLSSDMFVEE